MSPEQVRGEPADARSDLFAFGAVLYEMLSGRRAFGGRSAAETMSTVLRDEPSVLSGGEVQVPSRLERLVRRCIEKNPAERFQSARDLAFALSTALEVQEEKAAEADPSPSIVVLPFANLSPDPDDAYFSDGLTDEIITDLSRIRELRVVSATTAFRLKGSDKAISAIGQELKVRYALQGRVRKSGQAVRVTTQLIDVGDDRTVWADKYTGDLERVFELQESISQSIAGALQLHLGRSLRTPNPEAAAVYLKGRHFFRQATGAGLQQALECFRQATELDPNYAPVFAWMANTLVWLTSAWDAPPVRETMPRAQSAAQRALQLEPNLVEAHVALGNVATYYDWDPRAAERSFREALRLNVNDADAHFWYSMCLIYLDARFGEALGHLRRALELNPLDPLFQVQRVFLYYFTRDFERAIEQADQVIALEPFSGFGHYVSGTALATAGKTAKAMVALNRAIDLDGRGAHLVAWLGVTHALAGRREEALACLGELEAGEREGKNVAAWKLCIHAGLDDPDQVMRCLNEAYEERSASIIYHLVHPLTDCVRDDPKFVDLLRRMNLEHLAAYRGDPEWKPRRV